MAQTGTPRPAGSDQSLGELVAQAAKDVSQLIRGELNLAKVELRGDLRRVGMAVGLLAMSAFVGCLMLVLLCFAFAYGLHGARHLGLGLVPHRRRRLPAAHRPGRADRRAAGARGDRPARRPGASVQDTITMLRGGDQRPEIAGPAQR